MWLLTAHEMQAVDRDTIAAGTAASTLMERAGTAVARAAERLCGDLRGRRVEIVCGKGNNGGDGLVAARHLVAAGARVRVHATHPLAELAPEARACATRLGSTYVAPLPDPVDAALDAALRDAALCIDAVLGTGTQGAPQGRVAAAISAIARASCPILAVDIPSGVDGETAAVPGAAVRADLTVTFGAAKIGHAFFPGRAHCGRMIVADIGFADTVLQQHAHGRTWVDRETAAVWWPPLSPLAHKYTRGAVVIVAGSRQYTGAAALAATAALRSGAGIVHLVVPHGVRAILQSKSSEVIVHGVEETAAGALAAEAAHAIAPLVDRARALVVGPGLGDDESTRACVAAILGAATIPAVVDADALSALAADVAHPGARIATPHAGELARWAGEPVPQAPLERIEFARRVASARRVTLVAKGAPAVVTGEDGAIFVNASGHAGLATAGTGDVLAGVIGGLVAQGIAPAPHAAAVALWLHGRAAELATANRSPRSLVASDLLDHLGTAMAELEIPTLP